MQRKVRIGGSYVVPIETHIVDTYDEIAANKALGRAPQGTEVYVIRESKRYVKDSEGGYHKKECGSGGSGGITIDVDNLVNYYTKDETYTQEEVNTLIEALNSISFLVVSELPATGESNIIYLLPNTEIGDSIYDEMIYTNGAWEKIGDTRIDLSGYALIEDIPVNISELTNDVGFITNTVSDLVNYYTKTQIDAMIDTLEGEIPTNTSELVNDSNFVVDANYVHTDNNFTTVEKDKLASLENYDDTSIQNSIDQLETNKQDTLQSGVNIKTINGETLLGSGDIKIDLAPKVFSQEYTETEMTDKVFNVEHNFGTTDLIISVYDNTNQLIMPDETVIVDDNNIKIDVSSFVFDSIKVVILSTGGEVVRYKADETSLTLNVDTFSIKKELLATINNTPKFVTMTQEEYDNLAVKDDNTFYDIPEV